MDRERLVRARRRDGFPHARGDGPKCATSQRRRSRFSPRTWGWTAIPATAPITTNVFPTHVGMDRAIDEGRVNLPRFPHARGDGPFYGPVYRWKLEFSPRTWGWTVSHEWGLDTFRVFPTHVGMDRVWIGRRFCGSGFPHARGDGPRWWRAARSRNTFSPRTWGWTGLRVGFAAPNRVFPTHVGMDRRCAAAQFPCSSFPHARGDGPSAREEHQEDSGFSPRTWGWTDTVLLLARIPSVFPTHVGMDRVSLALDRRGPCFPHARGDGPIGLADSYRAGKFSPRTWGWTACSNTCRLSGTVFPTHVGMDRFSALFSSTPTSFPHARGDGPYHVLKIGPRRAFSPRTWGWTGSTRNSRRIEQVFPTHVGMDRSVHPTACAFMRFPHARGDGPRVLLAL